MKYDVKDLNAPSRWNMRIWDDDNDEWLCQSDKNASTYYGFDITGGEITEFQGLPKWHTGRHLIWEQSTGLKDRYGKEIYEGDIVLAANMGRTPYVVKYREGDCSFVANNEALMDYYHLFSGMPKCYEVIGNVHENPELLETNDVD